jgi:hypothetical protein
VKKIPAHQYKIGLAFYCIPLQDIDPRVEKIARALRQLIACAAQVHVRNMQKLHSHIVTDSFADTINPARCTQPAKFCARTVLDFLVWKK